MSERTDQVPVAEAAQSLLVLCSGLLPVWTRHLASCRSQSERAVSEMMQALTTIAIQVQQAQCQSQQLAQQAQEMTRQFERMHIAFQYQDRISQMMALLEQDMARLQAVVQGRSQDPLALADWLERLQAQYAMSDQRRSHAAPGGASGRDGPDSGITFF